MPLRVRIRGEHRKCDLLSGIGLDLMLAFLAPDKQPDAGGGSIAERDRRAMFERPDQC